MKVDGPANPQITTFFGFLEIPIYTKIIYQTTKII
jgi:hypothetical protein